MRRFLFFLSLLGLTAAPASAELPGHLQLEPAFDGLSFPVGLRHAGDGSGFRFIIERRGTIQIVDAAGTLQSQPFIDIQSLTSGSGERGLLGLAFHPDYASNGRVFINHTANGISGVSNGDTLIVEYQVDPLDPTRLDPDSRQVLMVIAQDAANHNGGDIHFGPDGYLYIGLGDGGGGNDPCDRGQTLDPSTAPNSGCRTDPSAWLLGKMLRIDVNSSTPAGSNNLCAAETDGSAAWAVPADNPWVGQTDRCGEVWSYGQRNPYRFSFDRVTGDLWVGDVGQSSWEEINFELAASSGGLNYGWKVCEGSWQRGSTTTPCPLKSSVEPVIEYANAGDNCSVTGGFRYRGPIDSMRGYYVYGDYCSGVIWFASESAPGIWTSEPFGQLSEGFGGLTGFGEDEAGNLYLTRSNGEVLMFSDGSVLFQDRFEQH